MRNIIARLCIFTLACLALSASAQACSSIIVPPTAIDSSWIAFAGTVIDYSISAGEVLKQGGVPAVVVRVTAPLLSASVGDQFDIFVFGVAPDCSPVARGVQDLMEQYPRGSTVTIVGSATVRDVPRSRVGIVTSVNDWGSLARLPGAIPRRANGLLNFPEFAKLYEAHPGSGFSLEVAWRNTHRSWFEDYEYLRALTFLAQESSRLFRPAILGDLGAYTRWRQIAVEPARARYRALLVQADVAPEVREKLLAEMAERRQP
jgi:hypothetical protein